jgi:hypothetical protein
VELAHRRLEWNGRLQRELSAMQQLVEKRHAPGSAIRR